MSIGIQSALTGTVDVGQVLVDTAVGILMGGLGGSALSLLVMTIAGSVVGFAGSLAGDWVGDSDFKSPDVWLRAAVGGVMGAGAQNGQIGTGKIILEKKSKFLSKHNTNFLRKSELMKYTMIKNSYKEFIKYLNIVTVGSLFRSFSYNVVLEFYQAVFSQFFA
jgi:hypothetical protein